MAVSWLLMWLANLMPHVRTLTGIHLYYPLVVIYLLYLAVSRPLAVARVMLRPVMLVWALTALIPLLMWMSASSHAFAYIAMRDRIVFFSLIACSAVLLEDRNARAIASTAGLLALLIAIPFNLLELVIPNILSTAPGRSAGFYINPNIAAAALIISMLLTVDFSRHRRRDMVVMFFAYLAVLTTFSRANILFATFALAVYILVPQGRNTLSGGQRISLLVVGVLVLAITSVAVLNFVTLDPEAYGRIYSILAGDYRDNSAQIRLENARWALDQFLGHFWTGRGLGSPDYYGLSTHNSFLAVSVEFGITGLLIYLLLLFQGLLKIVRYGRQAALNISLLALYMVFDSAFSHQVHIFDVYAIGFSALITDTLLKPDADDASPAT